MARTSLRTGNARLLRLAALLRTLPRKRFDYTTWVGYDWEGDPDLSCGTTACALGWATTIPSLRRAGLALTPWAHGGGSVTLNGRFGALDAAEELFALEDFEARLLFAPWGASESRATPKQVAKKIEKFVAERTRG